MKTTNWKDIKGYEGQYQIRFENHKPLIKSLKRMVHSKPESKRPFSRTVPEKILTICKTNKGFLQVNLARKNFKLQSLISENYDIKTMSGHKEYIAYIDEDITNVNPDNLLGMNSQEHAHQDQINRVHNDPDRGIYVGGRKTKRFYVRLYQTVEGKLISHRVGSYKTRPEARVEAKKAYIRKFKGLPITNHEKVST